MNLQEATEKATELMQLHGLFALGYTFRINSKLTSVCGRCWYGKKKLIELNEYYVLNAPDSEIINTILHEIAHALDAAKRGKTDHSAEWVKVAKEIGCTGEIYNTSGCHKPGKYLIFCPECAMLISSSKPVKGNCCSKCSNEKKRNVYIEKFTNETITDETLAKIIEKFETPQDVVIRLGLAKPANRLSKKQRELKKSILEGSYKPEPVLEPTPEPTPEPVANKKGQKLIDFYNLHKLGTPKSEIAEKLGISLVTVNTYTTDFKRIINTPKEKRESLKKNYASIIKACEALGI